MKKIIYLLFLLFSTFYNCCESTNQKIYVIFESVKVLIGDTLSIECPQSNATWFYRSVKNKNEDLIVTRHGIVNAEYKRKITMHPILKHKIIFISKVEADDDGVYSCLYTKSMQNNFNDYDDEIIPIIQERRSFNVSVYSLINGLLMNIKPLNRQSSELVLRNSIFEMTEKVLTAKENEELLITCVVEKSKPAADIGLFIIDDDKIENTGVIVSQSELLVQHDSTKVLSNTNTNVIRNDDNTFKTVFTSNFKVTPDDHGKMMTCNAENSLSNQKWENRRILNVLFAPVCKDQENFQYFIGINQSITIECRIKNANPKHVNYDWHFTNNRNFIDYTISNSDVTQGSKKLIKSNNTTSSTRKTTSITPNDRFISKIKLKPKSIQDFGEIKCIAANDIGINSCLYELKLGGIPNPPYDCKFTVKNSSAIILCQVGYPQGDPDIYCYLLRKSDNGVYKEHTRSRDACSFIVNDVPEDRLNEFWIYTSNKFGHNKEDGYYLTIGQVKMQLEVDDNGNKALIFIASVCGGTFILIIACCICIKIRKSSTSEDSDSDCDNDLQKPPVVTTYNFNRGNEYQEKMQAKITSYDLTFDREKILKDNNNYNKYGFKKSENDEKKNSKNKFDAFRYDNTQKFVSLLETKQKLKDDENNKKGNTKRKKTFSFLNNQDGLKSREVSSDDVIHQSQKSPLFKNSYENEDDDNYDEDDEEALNSTKLLNNLEDKLFAIAAGTLTLGSAEELYSTTKKQQNKESNKDASFNTLSTNLHSDSSTNNSIKNKMITFASANSLDNNELTSRTHVGSTKQYSPRESPENIYSTIKRVKMPASFLSNAKTISPIDKIENSNDIYESKFLSNLCEEIELTLNGECVHDESSSSAQLDSNVNSEVSTSSSVGQNVKNKKFYANGFNTKISKGVNNHNNEEDNNSNMIVDTSRLPNERNNDYNYNNRTPHDELAIRKQIVNKSIGVLV